MWRLLLVISSAIIIENVNAELKFVFATTRGMSHTPCDYPGGPTITRNPEKSSQLTEAGKDEALKIGKLLSERYKSNLKVDKWDPKKNYWTLASTTRRSQEGALFIGSGLEGKSAAEWSEKKGNETSFSGFSEYAKFYSQSACPNFITEQMNAVQNLLQNSSKQYKAAFDKLKSEYSINAMTSPQNVWLAYETLNLQSKQTKAPTWFNNMKNDLKSFSEKYVWTALTSNDNLRKMSGGRMINDILNDIESIRKGDGQPGAPGKTGNKLSVLTVPQGILAAFVSAFAPKGTKIENKDLDPTSLYPGQGALHVIELYKDKNNKWNVKILYRNNDQISLKPMKLASCGDECPYESFKSTLDAYNMKKEDHDELCKRNKTIGKKYA